MEHLDPKGCEDTCQLTPSVEALNRSCRCLTLDESALRHQVEGELGAWGLSEGMVDTHPRAHALYADKRNLTLVRDETFLRSTGVSDELTSTLLEAIPRTEVVTAEKMEAMWANRRRLFFKPAAGYGSKAAYRGDKLTKRVWAEIGAGVYVAQALVVPSERSVADTEAETPLKVDVRNHAYEGKVIQVAARLYQGQTTNFRTPRGALRPCLPRRRDRRPRSPWARSSSPILGP